MTRTVSSAVLVVLSLVTLGWAQSTPDAGGLQPGDIIRIRVWREPDLSGEFAVLEDGTAVLPRLGAYPVAGKRLEDVQRELVEEYSHTLIDPSVEIVIMRRVMVAGEVRAPGFISIDPTMKLADALLMAGGPLPSAKENRVELVRDGERTTYRIRDALLVEDLPLQSGDLLYVPKKNWFVRNWKTYTGVLSTVLSLSAIIIARTR